MKGIHFFACLSEIFFNPNVSTLNTNDMKYLPFPTNQLVEPQHHFLYQSDISVQSNDLDEFCFVNNVTNNNDKWTLLMLPQGSFVNIPTDFVELSRNNLRAFIFLPFEHSQFSGGDLKVFDSHGFQFTYSGHEIQSNVPIALIFSAHFNFTISPIASGTMFLLTKLLKVEKSEENKDKSTHRRLYLLDLTFDPIARANDEFHVRESYPNYNEMYFEILRKYEGKATFHLSLTDLCKLAYYKAKIFVDRQTDEYFKHYLRSPEEKQKYADMYTKITAAEDLVFGEYLPPRPKNGWKSKHRMYSELEMASWTFAVRLSKKYAQHSGHRQYSERAIWDEWHRLYDETVSYFQLLHFRERCLKEGHSEKECLYVRDLVKYNQRYFGEL